MVFNNEHNSCPKMSVKQPLLQVSGSLYFCPLKLHMGIFIFPISFGVQNFISILGFCLLLQFFAADGAVSDMCHFYIIVFQWTSHCSIFSFLCSVMSNIVWFFCPFSFGHCSLYYMSFIHPGYPSGIFNLFFMKNKIFLCYKILTLNFRFSFVTFTDTFYDELFLDILYVFAQRKLTLMIILLLQNQIIDTIFHLRTFYLVCSIILIFKNQSTTFLQKMS